MYFYYLNILKEPYELERDMMMPTFIWEPENMWHLHHLLNNYPLRLPNQFTFDRKGQSKKLLC